jgi:hypothetical protein
MILIGRPINGISINGLEYVLDAPDGEPMEFVTEKKAQDFLEDNGVDPEHFDDFMFVDTETDEEPK